MHRLRIALIGTRGVPARYGGFETAVEEIGGRLAQRGHSVTVYCRSGGQSEPPLPTHLGMRLVQLPAAKRKTLETLSHTALSTLHAVTRGHPDVAVVFNAANSPFLPALRLRGIPVATHVDGLEWKRAKWGGSGKRYYRVAEALAVQWSDALIADAQGIEDYYRAEFNAPTVQIAYGAPIIDGRRGDRLGELGLSRHGYHLVVARFEPENHVDLAVDGYRASAAQLPLVVVGSAPYADAYTERIRRVAAGDRRVIQLGGVWDQELLDQLYANAAAYVHGHSVGGTNPSLLRAMGAGADVLAYDVNFNRDVMGSRDVYWSDAPALAKLLNWAERDRDAARERGNCLRRRAAQHYSWEDVANDYESLCQRLVSGAPGRWLDRPGLREVARRALSVPA